jgi:hypothetical protein|tara:strand:+ start:236 stop:997 length:762 start_codon:yes stop_codon:yes gene_type:complete
MDIQQIKDRLNSLQRTQSTADSFWKPPAGKTQIRIVPYKFNKDNPFIELYFHYSMGDNKTHLSPVSFGRPDPINEFAGKLKSTGEKDEWIQGKRLEPKMRTFAPVLVRGKEQEGVKFWGFGKTVYQELLSFIADPDYGDISDSMAGRDIVVERQTPAEAGNQYGKTTIRVKPNQTGMVEDADMMENLLNSQTEITDLYTEPEYDELKQVLANYLTPSSTEEDTQAAAAPVASAPASSKTVASVDDAFDELFKS